MSNNAQPDAPHPFDRALALEPHGPNRWLGQTSPAYANMVGPFGGLMAAQALQAVLGHPELLGTPVSLTVNFAAALADGAFEVHARPVRTNRSTQHWLIEFTQAGQTMLTATAFTALRRAGWGADELPAPAVAAPEQVTRAETEKSRLAWLAQYEMRIVEGSLPTHWDGGAGDTRTLMWLRDAQPRPLDFASVAALADTFLPRIFLRRRTLVPIGTVSMTSYFHADAAQLAAIGTGHLLAEARAGAFRSGYFEQNAHLWSQSGDLLCSSHQVVYYKE